MIPPALYGFAASAAGTAQGVVPDTVVTVLARDGLQTAAAVSVVVLGVFLLAALVILVILLRRLRALERSVRGVGDRALERAGPLLESGKAAADNVAFITRAVRTDVERLHVSVKTLNDRLDGASDRMEERIREFNALMDVVQGEAEDIFLDTASTVRGVRAGARKLGGEEEKEPGGASAEEPDRLGEAETVEEDDVYLTAPPGAPLDPGREG